MADSFSRIERDRADTLQRAAEALNSGRISSAQHAQRVDGIHAAHDRLRAELEAVKRGNAIDRQRAADRKAASEAKKAALRAGPVGAAAPAAPSPVASPGPQGDAPPPAFQQGPQAYHSDDEQGAFGF